MKKVSLVLTLIPLVFLVGLACALPVIFDQRGGWVTPAEQSPSRLLRVLFQDDFSNPASGWTTASDDEGTNAYMNGGFRIFVNKANWYLWSILPDDFNDVIVELQIARLAGPEKNDFGVLCRYQDERNFYKLVLGSDGYYGVSKVIDGNEQLVGMEQMGFDDRIIQTSSGKVIRLRVECVGERLTLIANGEVLADVKDAALASGSIGLIAGAYDTPGVDILFDNLVVIQP